MKRHQSLTGSVLIVAPADASSAALSAAEDGRVSSATRVLVHGLLAGATRSRNPQKLASVVDSGQRFRGRRGAGMEGGSRGVRRRPRSDRTQGGRGRGRARGSPPRNPEPPGDPHRVRLPSPPRVDPSFPGVSSPGPTGCGGVSASLEKNPRNPPAAFAPRQTSGTSAVSEKCFIISSGRLFLSSASDTLMTKDLLSVKK